VIFRHDFIKSTIDFQALEIVIAQLFKMELHEDKIYIKNVKLDKNLNFIVDINFAKII